MSDSASYRHDFGALDEGSDDDCDPLSPPPPPPAVAPDDNDDDNDYDDGDYDGNDYDEYNGSEYSYQCDASISNASKVSNSSTVVERSNLMLASRRQREEQLRRQLREREDRNIQPGPTINKRSQQLHRDVNDMFEWDRARRAKIDALAEQVRAAEDAQNTGRPIIPKKRSTGSCPDASSDPLIAATSSMPVEDRLLAYEERRLMKIASLKEQQRLEARQAATPKLAPRSMNLQRHQQQQPSSTRYHPYGVDAEDDRIHCHNDASYEESLPSDYNGGICEDDDDSSDFHEALSRNHYASSRSHSSSTSVASSKAAALKTTSKAAVHDPATGQLLFQPRINKLSRRIAMSEQGRSCKPIEQLLIEKSEQQRLKLEQKERRQAEMEQWMRNASKINPASNKMVEDRYILQGETTQDRLAKPIGNVKPGVLSEADRYSFRPTISKGSQELLASSSSSAVDASSLPPHTDGGRLSSSTTVAQAARRREKEQYIEQRLRIMERVHCSQDAAPSREHDCDESYLYTHTHSSSSSSVDEPLLYEDLLRQMDRYSSGTTARGQHLSDKSTSSSSSSSLSMYQKSKHWNDMRQMKLLRERKQRERELLSECSFKPRIEESFSASSYHHNHNSYHKSYEGGESDIMMMRSKGSLPSDGGSSIADRQVQWMQKREQKLEVERRKKELDAVKDCSFAPHRATSLNKGGGGGGGGGGSSRKGDGVDRAGDRSGSRKNALTAAIDAAAVAVVHPTAGSSEEGEEEEEEEVTKTTFRYGSEPLFYVSDIKEEDNCNNHHYYPPTLDEYSLETARNHHHQPYPHHHQPHPNHQPHHHSVRDNYGSARVDLTADTPRPRHAAAAATGKVPLPIRSTVSPVYPYDATALDPEDRGGSSSSSASSSSSSRPSYDNSMWVAPSQMMGRHSSCSRTDHDRVGRNLIRSPVRFGPSSSSSTALPLDDELMQEALYIDDEVGGDYADITLDDLLSGRHHEGMDHDRNRTRTTAAALSSAASSSSSSRWKSAAADDEYGDMDDDDDGYAPGIEYE